MTRFRFCLLLPILAVALAGCDLGEPRLPAGPGPFSPFIEPATISVIGGNAANMNGRSGGAGGQVAIQVDGGVLMLDDGRPASQPVIDFLADAQPHDKRLTWEDLVALQPPFISAGVATFTLAGSGMSVPQGLTLDLSGAPANGGTPVHHVRFMATGAIHIAGTVVTAREDAPAVGLTLQTVSAVGISLTGLIDTSGAPGFDSGAVVLEVTTGWILCRGRILAHGGSATADTDAGTGGGVTVTAFGGDVLLSELPILADGGNGNLHGGNGGGIEVALAGGAPVEFDWVLRARGGSGHFGDGGPGGTVLVDSAGALDWLGEIRLNGGDSVHGDNAGGAGTAHVSAEFLSGQLRVVAEGGNGKHTGGNGGACLLEFTSLAGFDLIAFGRGGGGVPAGDGGVFAFVGDEIDDAGVSLLARGGDGGGEGGRLEMDLAGPGIMKDVFLDLNVGGGNHPGGPGGPGGTAALEVEGSLIDCWVEVEAPGGQGASGGAAGRVEVVAGFGIFGAVLDVNATGGPGATGAGGAGGELTVQAGDEIELDTISVLDGGSGASAGGHAGTLTVLIGATGLGSTLEGHVSIWGGDGATAGGDGGMANLGGGQNFGVYALEFTLVLRGGQGNNGGRGGDLLVAGMSNPVSLGFVDARGGDGATTGGTGGGIEIESLGYDVFLTDHLWLEGGSGVSGGAGGTLSVHTDGGVLFLEIGVEVRLDGGNGHDGPGGVGGKGGELVFSATNAGNPVDDSGSVYLVGAIFARGGNGGGNGGDVTVATAGPQLIAAGAIIVDGGSGGDGGEIVLGDDDEGAPVSLSLTASALLQANGVGNGLAGFITLNPDGDGPGNPGLDIHPSASIFVMDGDGTDRSDTNLILD